MHKLPNVLVFSAGGYGHVPIPLLKQPEPPRAAVTRVTAPVLLGLMRAAPPFARRTHLVSFVGSLGHAPHGLRERMVSAVSRAAARHGFRWVASRTPLWRGVASSSNFSLCPRGFGRTKAGALLLPRLCEKFDDVFDTCQVRRSIWPRLSSRAASRSTCTPAGTFTGSFGEATLTWSYRREQMN